MSLINQMLVDLDERQAPEVARSAEPLRDVERASRPARGLSPAVIRRVKWIASVASVIAVVLVMAPPVPVHPVAPTPASMPASAVVVPSPAPEAVVAAVPVREDNPETPVQPRPVPVETTVAVAEPVMEAEPETHDDAAPVEEATPAPASDAGFEKVVHIPTPAEQAETLMDEGRGLGRAGEYDTAQARYLQGLALVPGHTGISMELGIMLLNQGKPREAGDVLQRALAANPRHADLIVLLARARVQQGETDAAISLLEQGRASGLASGETLAFLAALYQRNGQHRDAIALYREVLSRQPGAHAWQVGLGISLDAVGQKQAALQVYEAALKSPTLPAALRQHAAGRMRALRGPAQDGGG